MLTDLDKVQENILIPTETFIQDNLKQIKKMVSEGLYILTKANITANGQMVKNKDKECIFIQIKMYFRVIG